MAEIQDQEISTAGATAFPEPALSSYPTGSYPIATGDPAPGTAGFETDEGGGKVDEAKQKAAATADQIGAEAAGVKDHALQVAGDVKAKAGEELSSITDEARGEVKNLALEARDRIGSQLDSSTKQLASVLSDAGQELRSMAERSEKQGPLTDIVRQLGTRVETVAGRLENEGYQSIANDVTRFARNKPGTFLLLAGTAGFVVGRMLRNTDTKAIADAAKGDQADASPEIGSYGTGIADPYAPPAYPVTEPVPVGLVGDDLGYSDAERYAPSSAGTTTYGGGVR